MTDDGPGRHSRGAATTAASVVLSPPSALVQPMAGQYVSTGLRRHGRHGLEPDTTPVRSHRPAWSEPGPTRLAVAAAYVRVRALSAAPPSPDAGHLAIPGTLWWQSLREATGEGDGMDAPDQQAVTVPPRAHTRPGSSTLSTSHVEFAVRHLMISTFKGYFTASPAPSVLDEVDLSHSRVEVTIDAASWKPATSSATLTCVRPTSSRWRPIHRSSLRAGVEPGVGERAKVSGDLTIHGVTRPGCARRRDQRPQHSARGRCCDGLFGEHHEQPQGLRADLERGPGCRRRRRRRRGHDPARDRGGRAALTHHLRGQGQRRAARARHRLSSLRHVSCRRHLLVPAVRIGIDLGQHPLNVAYRAEPLTQSWSGAP